MIEDISEVEPNVMLAVAGLTKGLSQDYVLAHSDI